MLSHMERAAKEMPLSAARALQAPVRVMVLVLVLTVV
jgi:hypothetical protein